MYDEAGDLANVVRDILTKCPAERVWLFGSRARGDHHPGSDWDLLVMVPDGSAAAARPEDGTTPTVDDAPVDIHVMAASDFLGRLHLRASFPATVVREGRILYERESMSSIDARELMERALGDLRVADTLASGDDAHVRAALLHLEEALEKAAKALLVQHDIAYDRQHDLRYLGRLMESPEPGLAGRLRDLATFAGYARDLRYPDNRLDAPERGYLTEQRAIVGRLVGDLDDRVAELAGRPPG